MAREVTIAQVQVARANETNELNEDVGFALRRSEQATFDDHFWQGVAIPLAHPFLRNMRGGIDEPHSVLTSQRPARPRGQNHRPAAWLLNAFPA